MVCISVFSVGVGLLFSDIFFRLSVLDFFCWMLFSDESLANSGPVMSKVDVVG